ncbi:hypothetical protein GHT06_016026 [Daphnia sinensis]|uniref:Beta-1,4-N-acetylgalactosaminyltransferase n=1 Tax=Daphnia sinensis TaxID=1820382 RepID=A0AAD5KUB7_9CRUS|nr:hypothetical protein GHT06_016026 [Daphnia sinensis]
MVVCSSLLRATVQPLLAIALFLILWINIKDSFLFTNSLQANQLIVEKELCPLVSPKLVGWTDLSLARTTAILEQDEKIVESEMRKAGVQDGGRYEPSECQSRHKVAIVVPYRDRKKNLAIFLRYLHPFLQRQQLSYMIIVVEQSGHLEVNRGMLRNIGFKEAQLLERFQCFIFHDVDFLPEDDRNPYTCPEDGKPRQMAYSIDYWDDYRPTPANHFGGVTALSATDFQLVNGYSNAFWGWGGEDDQLYQRVLFHNLTVTRAVEDQPSLLHQVHYKTLPHPKEKPNPRRNRILKAGSKRFKSDGLINLQYRRMALELKPLYTYVLVDIDDSSPAHWLEQKTQ